MTGLVYLASYPRSGNTLLRMILAQCFGLKTVSAYDEAVRIAACPDWLSWLGTVEHWDKRLLDKMNAEQGVLPFKTHDHPQNTPDPDAPTIYVIRDGREACVSYWRYHRDLLRKPDVSLADVIRGDCMFGSWSDHARVWYQQGLNHRVRYVRYEAMRLESDCTVGRLANFLDREPIARAITPWDQLHQADPAFFRSGTNDTWRELMTGDDLALFDELHGETMREYGYSEEVCHAAT
jgi:hypothetical protein